MIVLRDVVWKVFSVHFVCVGQYCNCGSVLYFTVPVKI